MLRHQGLTGRTPSLNAYGATTRWRVRLRTSDSKLLLEGLFNGAWYLRGAYVGPVELLRGITPRERALQAFAQMNVWDTDANNGVLIYVLWADHDVEIIADRGFNGRVGPEGWAEVCRAMDAHFRSGDPRRAVLEGIAAVGALAARHFPVVDRDELPNRPVVL